MKVYSLPKEIPPPAVDYSNYDGEKEAAAEVKHMADLKEWLIKQGFTGRYTGQTVHFGVADGRAIYMMADGKKSFLIHLPYGDGYQYRDVEFLPKAEIIRRIEATKKMEEFWRKRTNKE
jgi:hypothetical protein